MAAAARLANKRQHAIAERIHSILVKNGMTQRDLANRTGMKDSAISRILQGDANLTIKTITVLEQGLGEPLITIH